MDKVSVIVPVYNAEKYIGRCIDSIMNQTYKNLEIILIDDGSQDTSGKICDEYAAHDDRIIVVHKENGGVSNARNVGLSKATGDYIAFVDADDYIETQMYDTMIKKMKDNNAKIVKCRHRFVYDDKIVMDRYIKNEKLINLNDKRVTLIEDFLTNKTTPSFWTLLINKTFLDQAQLKFDTDLIIGEDFLFVLELYFSADFIYVDDDVFYNYCIYSQSASHSTSNNKKIINNLLLMHKKMRLVSVKNDVYEFLNESLAYYVFNSIFYRLLEHIATIKDKTILDFILDKENEYHYIISQVDVKKISKCKKAFLFFSKHGSVLLCYFLLFFYGKLMHYHK